MEFKKKYPCTQCIFLTTKESTLAKHMQRHQNVTEGEQVSYSSSPPLSDISPVPVLSSSKLPTLCKSTISEETNPSSPSMIADEVNTSKRIVNVFKIEANIGNKEIVKRNHEEENITFTMPTTQILQNKRARGREVVSEETKFKCRDCERIFNSHQALNQHIKSKHEGVKYACNQCDYQATQQGHLTTHIQFKHEGVKYTCNKCDQQFTHQSSLTAHIQSKHEGVKYVCNQCDQQFTAPNGLTMHIQSKHEGVKYTCNLCNQQFAQQGYLTMHIQSQNEGVKFDCNQCEYQASRKDHLTSHIKRKHL